MHNRVGITDNVWYTSNILLTIREKQDVTGIHGKIKKTQSFLKIKKPKVSCLIIKANVFVSVFLLLSIGIYKIGMCRKIYMYVFMYVYIPCLLKKVHLLSIMTS